MNNTEMQSMEIPYQKVGDCYVNDLEGRQSVIPYLSYSWNVLQYDAEQ